MSRYTVGIDLGTTNTALAYADAKSGAIRLFQVEQLVAPGEVAGRRTLPSVRYHPADGEFNAGDIALPWSAPDPGGLTNVIIGTLARDRGAQVPGRLVASAKSWLSHRQVDRTAAILPWGAGEGIARVSPVAASASYLAHLVAAWNYHFPAHPLEQQEVVLTVPASFDEAARELTVQAARLAGLNRMRLLEEPQAVLYDWLARNRQGLVAALAAVRLVLVCDIGGGTTDFSLIEVNTDAPELQLNRIGVGDHLMLGGDNMDLGLARVAEGRLAAAGAPLGAGRLAQLTLQCRAAKERLLGARPPSRAAVTLLGGGAGLIGGARTTELERDEVRAMVVDGFFPEVDPDERPQRTRGGIVEFGLPYVPDPAVTRHLAEFLGQHAEASRRALDDRAPAGDQLPVPDAVLLNGGVFHSAALVERLLTVLNRWRGGAPVTLLENPDPDLAVARGAVAYAQARTGAAPRIGGGSARSYFLLVDGQGRQGVCLLPKGTEEAQPLSLTERSFALRVGRPVRFHLVSSMADRGCDPGAVVDVAGPEFSPLPALATVIEAGARRDGEVPVALVTELTEVGTLRMQLVSKAPPAQHWELAFQLRGAAEGGMEPVGEMPARFGEAAGLVDQIYGTASRGVDPKAVKRLRRELEQRLGPRATWGVPLLRELYTVVWNGVGHRRRSPGHERLWFHLAGYCLRPGFGYPLDDWRMEQLWELYGAGVQYVNESQGWSEWWTLWRRVAGGLDASQQARILQDLIPTLQLTAAPRGRTATVRLQAADDMLRLAASLERIGLEQKVALAHALLERLQKPGEPAGTWWALGRIAARQPFYGSTHGVVPPEQAAPWLESTLRADWRKSPEAAFAAAQIARCTGDRARDLERSLRAQVAQRLRQTKAPEGWVRMVETVVELDETDEGRMFGESLPPGLKLIR